MPTLYVENVPSPRYKALRKQARARGRSIATEVLAILEQTVPTAEELSARRALFHKLARLRRKKPRPDHNWTSTEDIVRQDRMR